MSKLKSIERHQSTANGGINPSWVSEQCIVALCMQSLAWGKVAAKIATDEAIMKIAFQIEKAYQFAPSDVSEGHGELFSILPENQGRDISLGAKDQDIFQLTLFEHNELNSAARIFWSGFKEFSQESPHWSFWRDWYQGFLDGKPLDWELQRRVALIPDADWDEGPAHIAAKIEEIKADFLAEKAPLAEVVEFDHDTGKFYTTPLAIENSKLLGTHLQRAEDALEDALNGRNGLTENSRETRVLRRTFDKYALDPERIEMDFVDVHNGLARQMASGELPESEENRALADTLLNGALDIRATHPEIADNRAVRAKQAIRELPEDKRAELAEALPVLEAISDDKLAQEFREDFRVVLNDAVGPLPGHAPALPGIYSTNRIASRVAKISLWIRSSAVVRKIDGSAEYKAVGILKTIYDLVKLLIGLLS